MENDSTHPGTQANEKADERSTSRDLFGWMDMAEETPPPDEACDFLYTGDEDEDHVWMLLSATLESTIYFEGTIVYWRPASPLPPGVARWQLPPIAQCDGTDASEKDS